MDTVGSSNVDVDSVEQLPEDIKAKCEELVHEFVGKI